MTKKHLSLGRLLAILLALALLGWVAFKAVRVAPHVRALWQLVPRFQALAQGGLTLDSLDAGQLAALREDLGAAEASLRGLRAELPLALALCPHLGWLPRVGAEVAAAPAALDLGIELLSAGWWGLLGAEPLLDLLPQLASLALGGPEGADALLEAGLARLAASQPYFLQSGDALARAAEARGRFDAAGFMPRLAELVAMLDRYLPLAQAGVEGLLLAPALLSADGPQTYLLLAQNSHELRPTGGLISGVGTLVVDGAQVGELSLRDSYAYDSTNLVAHPPAPEPLAAHMWAGVLLLRDANWSPDFPTSAEVVANLYELSELGAPVDAVIAVDLVAVQRLFAAVAPIQPEGYPEAVTGENIIALLQRYWAAPAGEATIAEQASSDWWAHRKDIMGDLVAAALDKVGRDPWSVDLGQLGAALMDSLRGRHLLIYARDPEAAALLAERGWDGALRPVVGDYLMAVDANLGFNKVDASIERRIDYRVDLSQSPPQAMVTLAYANRSPEGGEACRHEDLADRRYYQASSYEDLMVGCYWDYLRLYLPADVTDLRSDAGIPVDRTYEGDKVALGLFFLVPPGESRQVRFQYALPEGLGQRAAAGDYALLLQKQPGVVDVPWQVTIGSGGRAFAFGGLLDRDVALAVALDERGGRWGWAIGTAIMGLILVVAGFWLRGQDRVERSGKER